MNALAQLSKWIVQAMDYPLGWLLLLPRDVAIGHIAVATSLFLAAVRKWTPSQDQLRRCGADVRRLRTLKRQARRARDKAAVARIRKTLGMVSGIKLKAEGKPLLAAVVPIILLAVWAVERLDYLPPRVDADLEVRAYYPLSSVGELTHLVPPAGCEMCGSAVRLVEVDPDGEANGIASWVLRPTSASESIELLIRHKGETASHPLSVGRRTYAPPAAVHGGEKILATEAVLRRARLFGVVPGIPAIAFPPWLVAYLLIAIPLVPVWRRVFRVH